MRIALDTNRYIDFARGASAVAAVLQRAREVWLPFIVVAELRTGFRLGSEPQKNERDLRVFLARPGVRVLFADSTTTQVYADLYVDLRRRNALIPADDLWIAHSQFSTT